MSGAERRTRLLRELAWLALAVLATAPLWTGRSWYLQDLRMYALPDLERLGRALRAGELRAWEPALFCGYPAIGGLCAAMFYPPTALLALLLPPLLAIKALIVLHAWWLARGAGWLVRQLGASPRAAVLAGAALLLGGSWAGHALDLNVQVTLAWSPWILGLAARAGARGGWRDPLLLAGAYGVMLFQGMPQWGVYLAAAAVWTALAHTPGDARGPGRAAPALRVGLGLGLAGLLAAPLLLPGIDYLRLYPRVHPGGWYAFASAGGVTLADLPAWLVGGQREYLEPFRPGAAVWALALVGLCAGWRAPSGRTVRVGLPLAAAGLLLCGGDGSPVFRVLVHLPLLRSFRCPARALVLTELGLVILAAGGADALWRGALRPSARRLGVGLGAGLFLWALALGWGAAPGWPLLGAGLSLVGVGGLALPGPAGGAARARRSGLALALLGLLAELGLAHHQAQPARPDAELLTPPPLAAPILRSDERRVLDLAGHEVPYELLVRRLRRNSGTLWGLEYVSGYESIPPLRQELLVDWLAERAERAPAELAARLAELSIRWVVLDEGRAPPGLRRAACDPLAGACLWEQPAARPRAYVLPRGGGPLRPADWTRPRAAELRIEAQGPGRLIVAEAWHPGWSATLDALPAPLWEPAPDQQAPTDLFLSVVLPPGAHEVVLRFEDHWLQIGLRVGAVAWLAWALLLWRVCGRTAVR